MGRPDRRDILCGAAAGFGSIAGCNGLGGRIDPGTTTRRGRAETDPEYAQVRNTEGEPVLRSTAHEPAGDGDGSEQEWANEYWMVVSPEQRDSLRYADDGTGVKETQAFVDATDLSEASLFVHQYRLSACGTGQLEAITWAVGEGCAEGVSCSSVKFEYGMSSTEDCQAPGPAVAEATVVRIPDELEGYASFSFSGITTHG